jgi:hypothetical protein
MSDDDDDGSGDWTSSSDCHLTSPSDMEDEDEKEERYQVRCMRSEVCPPYPPLVVRDYERKGEAPPFYVDPYYAEYDMNLAVYYRKHPSTYWMVMEELDRNTRWAERVLSKKRKRGEMILKRIPRVNDCPDVDTMMKRCRRKVRVALHDTEDEEATLRLDRFTLQRMRHMVPVEVRSMTLLLHHPSRPWTMDILRMLWTFLTPH